MTGKTGPIHRACLACSTARTAQKTALCAPASTTCKPHSSRGRGRPELGPSRLRDYGSISGLISGVIFGAISAVICESISGAAPSSLLPTGQENILVMTDSRSGRSSFDSKLISLLPLDDVPVHVHHFAARAPCDSKGSGCPGVSVESIQLRPPQPCEVGRAVKEKPMQPHNFLKHLPSGVAPQLARHALGRLPTPPPLPENLLLGLHRKLPSAPPASTQEVSESENRPAPRGTAHSEVQGEVQAAVWDIVYRSDCDIVGLRE